MFRDKDKCYVCVDVFGRYTDLFGLRSIMLCGVCKVNIINYIYALDLYKEWEKESDTQRALLHAAPLYSPSIPEFFTAVTDGSTRLMHIRECLRQTIQTELNRLQVTVREEIAKETADELKSMDKELSKKPGNVQENNDETE